MLRQGAAIAYALRAGAGATDANAPDADTRVDLAGKCLLLPRFV